jgi:hypothetical protein
MMRRIARIAFCTLSLAGAGCSDGPRTVESVTMALGAAGGLNPADVRSVEVLVLGGDRATCTRALQPQNPLDDPELDVLRHALFTVDGSAKHLSGIPADRHLVFYVEAFMSPDGQRPRIGRGCAEDTLAAGKSSGVSIEIGPVSN